MVKNILEFSKNIPKHLDTLKIWIDEFIASLANGANQLFKGFEAALELLTDLGVIITQKLDPNTGKVLVQGTDGIIYTIKQNDKTIFEGTEDAIKKFAQKVDEIRISGGNNKKKIQNHLDELAENLSVKYDNFLTEKKWKITKTPGRGKNIGITDDLGNVLFRGDEILVKKYIKFSQLSLIKKEELIKKMYAIVKANTGKSYNRARSNEKLKKLGYNIDIPPTKEGIGKGNGVTPDFSVMRDEMSTINGKLGNGSYDKIKSFGIGEIEDALSKIKSMKGIVNVNITSKRGPDFNNCWNSLGIPKSLGEEILEKLKLTWHHMDDLDVNFKSSLQLVITKVH